MANVEDNKTQPVATGGNKPKSKTGLIITIVVVVVVLLGVGGYYLSRYITHRASEKIIGGIIGTGSGSDVDISDKGVSVSNSEGTFSAGETTKWPSDMPSSVPQFKYGKITMAASTNTDGKGWSVTLGEVEPGSLEKYANDLSSAGWTKGDVIGSGADMSIITYTKDNYQVQAIYDASSKGVSIAVIQK